MSALSPRQLFLLDNACAPIREAFEDVSFGPYLVGTAAAREPYRDIDVRLMFKDDAYVALVGALGPRAVAFLGVAIGQYLASLTGAPIDFQIQEQSTANELHSGPRNPLGFRDLLHYEGDAQGAVFHKSNADAREAASDEGVEGL